MPPRTRKAAPVEVVEDVVEDTFDELDELEDLEDLEECVEPEPAPTKGRGRPRKAAASKPASTPKATASSAFGTAWLTSHINDTCGTTYDGRTVRGLLRKLAKEGVIQREVGTDKARYDFSEGAESTLVKAIIKRVSSGEIEDAKKAALDELKAKSAAKKAAKKAAADVDDEIVEDEIVDDEIVEDEPTPAPKRRRTPARKATPRT